jgi:peroxiredoxin
MTTLADREMPMTKKAILIAVIVLCLGGLLYLSLSPGQEPPAPALPAQAMTPNSPAPASDSDTPQAPDFSLQSIKGEKYTLSALRGKVVILNFWASSCPPCIYEMPTLEKLAQLMAGKQLQILTVTSDPLSMAQDTARRMGIKVPVLVDADGQVANSYAVYYTPITYIIDAQGNVNNRFMGAADWSDQTVVDYLNKLIATGSQPRK